MAWPLRVNVEGGWYHVFARGVGGRTIFRDDRDREHLLELLEETVERYRVEVHAYALLETHFHLVVRTPDANLSRAVQWLNQSYAAWYNTRHRHSGAVFQRPFGSVPVENGAWAYELSLYVHLNPLRIKALGLSAGERKAARLGAGAPPSRQQVLERLRKLRTYRWSSYRAYAGYTQAPAWLVTEELWRRATGKQSDRQATYRRDTQQRALAGAEGPQAEAIRDRLAVGSAAFVTRIQSMAAELGLGRETLGKRRLRERVTVQQVIAAVAEAKGEDWDAFRDRHGDWGAALVMWLARRCTGLTLREIGAAVGGMDYAAVCMAARRLAARLPHDASVRACAQKAARKLHVKM